MLPRHSKQSIRHDPRADTGAVVISTNAAARQNLTVGDGGDGQWRRVDPHPFLVANGLNRLSYVSLQSARGSRRVVRGNALRARGPVGKAEARTCRPSAAGTAGHRNELLPPALEKRRPAPAPPLPGWSRPGRTRTPGPGAAEAVGRSLLHLDLAVGQRKQGEIGRSELRARRVPDGQPRGSRREEREAQLIRRVIDR